MGRSAVKCGRTSHGGYGLASPRDTLLRLAAQNTWRLDRLEAGAVKEIAQAYARVRRELLGAITERRNLLYTQMARDEAATLRALARDVELLNQVEARMAVLQREVGQAAMGAWQEATGQAGDMARAELDILLFSLDTGPFEFNLTRVDYDSVEIGLEEALKALEGSQAQVSQVLRSELRVGLLRGESFDELTARLLAKDASVFARGEISAMLGARRNVIHANNAARDAFYRSWGEQIPGLQKQAIAAIDHKTTKCCLRVHGQIKPLAEPYELTAEPRFARKIMYPPFHWNCRTSSVAYHKDFERGAKVTTADMRDAAREELKAREDGSREPIKPAHATSGRGE